jgi:hypothetical protein
VKLLFIEKDKQVLALIIQGKGTFHFIGVIVFLEVVPDVNGQISTTIQGGKYEDKKQRRVYSHSGIRSFAPVVKPIF